MARAVLVTGASSGIGRASVRLLRKRGFLAVPTARKEEDLQSLREEGFNPLYLELTDPASIQRAAEAFLEMSEGRPYGVFLNAGFAVPGAVEDLEVDWVRWQFEGNLFGHLDLLNRLLPAMREAGEGRVVFNSSVLGFLVGRYRGAYSASKYAMEAFADAYRMELAGSGIFVSLIEPGPILTRFRENALAVFKKTLAKKLDQSPHRATYAKLLKKLEKPGPASPGTLPPEAVAKALLHALTARRPKMRYFVTWPTYAGFWAKRLLPMALWDRVLDR